MAIDQPINLDYQIATEQTELPSEQEVQNWIGLALKIEAETHGLAKQLPSPLDITVRIVEANESQQLNHSYRAKDKPTNVLSFPFENPPGLQEPLPILGDLVICAEVVAKEADEQNKSLTAHWAHMVIHGSLHLLSYDHINEYEAQQMESLEIEILAQFSISNPYEVA